MTQLVVSFERATPADAEALVEAQVRSFHSDSVLYEGIEEDGPPGYDSVETTLGWMTEYDFYKIVVNEEIVGGIILIEEEPGVFHLHILDIVPEFHNLGIGSRAMDFIETTYPATKWTLDTPSYAVRNHHFYEKLGYAKVGETRFENDFVLFNYVKQMPGEADRPAAAV